MISQPKTLWLLILIRILMSRHRVRAWRRCWNRPSLIAIWIRSSGRSPCRNRCFSSSLPWWGIILTWCTLSSRIRARLRSQRLRATSITLSSYSRSLNLSMGRCRHLPRCSTLPSISRTSSVRRSLRTQLSILQDLHRPTIFRLRLFRNKVCKLQKGAKLLMNLIKDSDSKPSRHWLLATNPSLTHFLGKMKRQAWICWCRSRNS
jgi:hypothetical protein